MGFEMKNKTIDKIFEWGLLIVGISILAFTEFTFWQVIGILLLITSSKFMNKSKQG
jgi:hypothetical protein